MTVTNKEIEAMEKLFGKKLPKKDPEDSLQERREEEAVAAYLDRPSDFQQRICKKCSKKFMSNRMNVGFCKRECLLQYLKDKWGLEKDNVPPNGPNDRDWVWKVWWDREPLIVTGHSLEVCDQILERSQERAVEEVPTLLEETGSLGEFKDFLSNLTFD